MTVRRHDAAAGAGSRSDGFADDLDAKLCFDVYAVNLAFARLYAPLLEPFALTYPQYLVLTLLWERDGRNVGEVGEVLDLKSSTLTPLLQRLAAAGLLLRTRDTLDQRRVHLTLTEAGRALRERLREVPDCVERATGLREEEIRALQRQLRRVRAHLGRAVRAT